MVYIRVVGWLFDYFNNLQLQLFENLKKNQRTSGSGFFWNKKELWFWSFEKFGIKEPEILVFMEEALDIFEIYGYLPKNKWMHFILVITQHWKEPAKNQQFYKRSRTVGSSTAPIRNLVCTDLRAREYMVSVHGVRSGRLYHHKHNHLNRIL